ncbi:polyamine transporter 3 [Verticillium alfalfae VaMs.102]|uniref:Polyamine transporter 3 n=1 Tax=Verticillium alfalfae (strain VaMs.102 / ATCC MYA-4576 / FGSC 10136) TaxID=526221 RepID=C9SKI4_VERA1|nr:polyamine transporter 3 [Verticillium alfalfae VaMs.102]EEY19202.1 polyamine transporter 3 [Verticillium alfalfae VaMs.102]
MSQSNEYQSTRDVVEAVRHPDPAGADAKTPGERPRQSLEEKEMHNGLPCTSGEDEEKTIVSWEDDDPENPYNWSSTRKLLILLLTMMLIINSTMGSALPSNAIPYISEQWNIASPQGQILPICVFMIGYFFGPILWGPLSEHFGRRIITNVTFILFTVWTLACALAPNFAALNVFRLFVGVFASAPIAVVPGIMADIYGNHETRGRAMSFFMATTCFGPLFAPIISGYCSPSIGWRWTFWIGLIYAGATLIPLLLSRSSSTRSTVSDPGPTGLALLPIGGGSLLNLPFFFAYDPTLTRLRRRHPALRKEEVRRLPLACVGGPLFVASLFWLGFTARPSLPFWVPMLAGLPFGAGFMLIFMALLNYLTDAYESFAASANAAASMARSFLAVVLPLATRPLFDRLGVAGACALLGGLSAVMVPIPFIFIWKGDRIPAASPFCIALRQQEDEREREADWRRRRREQAAAAAAAAAAEDARQASPRGAGV